MATALSRGRRVARQRESQGLSQEELARLCGCSVRTIMRIEAGANGAMSQRIRNGLHQHLGLSLSQLANGQKAPGRSGA